MSYLEVFKRNQNQAIEVIKKNYRRYNVIAVDTGFPSKSNSLKKNSNKRKIYDHMRTQVNGSRMYSLGFF